MDIVCNQDTCPIILSSKCVFYRGDDLIYTGIVTNDNLETALIKINVALQAAGIGYVFQNGLINIGGNVVELGGSLLHNTTISGNYTLTFAGNLKAGALITTGGSSTQFVKGDGSLDSTTYQPSGSYITALTGDGTATGPGSSVFTLATVNGSPGTYGDASNIPVVTVNEKGLVTNISTVGITVPSGSLSFNGDVTGSGMTGSPVTLTLATVNSNVYGTNTFLKFAVNGKGLVTSATPVTALDIDGVLGYIPVDNSITLTINGTSYDLSTSRSWSVGTVTNVTASSPLSSSGGTTPNITITQADSATDGYLSFGDWNIFNSKQAAGNYITDLSGDVVANGPGAVSATISNNAVTYAKMQNVSATSKLLGSSSTTTPIQEITVGSGLSLSGTTLSATGSGGTVMSFSAGNLSPLFTTNVTNPTTTPDLQFTLSNAGAHTWFGNNTGGSTTPSFNSAGSLSETTSAVLTITGSNTLLSNTTIQVIQSSGSTSGYLSSTDWTTFNSKLTSPLTTKGDILAYSSTNDRFPVATGNGKVLQVDSTAIFGISYSTPTYPSISGSSGKILRSDGTNNTYSTSTFADTYTASNLLYSNGANTVQGLATANNAILVTNGSGVPSLSTTLPSGLTGSFWALTGTSTLAGVATITSNTAAQHIFNGTWTATASNQNHIELTGTITSRNTASDTWNYLVIDPTLTRNAGNPATQIATAVLINSTFLNSPTTQYILRLQNAGSDRFTLQSDGTAIFTCTNTSTSYNAFEFHSTTNPYGITVFNDSVSTTVPAILMYGDGSGHGHIGASSGKQLRLFAGGAGGSVIRTTITSAGNLNVASSSTPADNANLYVAPNASSGGKIPIIRGDAPAYTGLTASTEFLNMDFRGATQTWIDGTVATQRFTYFRGFTANKTTTSAVFTDIYNVYIDQSTAGTGVTFTNNWALGLNGNLKILDGFNIGLGTSSGTQLGTSTSQKLGHYGVTPIVQPANTVAIDTLLVNLGLRASGGVGLFDTDVKLSTVGKGFYVKEGSNATMGVGTLSGGTLVVNTTKVTANSRIFLTDQGGTVTNLGSLYISARTAGTSFTVSSTNVLDASDFAWIIIEPS